MKEDHDITATAQVEPEVIFHDISVTDHVLWLFEVHVVQAGGQHLANRFLLLPSQEDEDTDADDDQAHDSKTYSFPSTFFRSLQFFFCWVIHKPGPLNLSTRFCRVSSSYQWIEVFLTILKFILSLIRISFTTHSNQLNVFHINQGILYQPSRARLESRLLSKLLKQF